MVSVFLGFIYLFFPIICYFLYVVYSKATFTKEKNLFYDLVLISSFYLCYSFGNLSETWVFLISFPFILSLYKERNFVSFFLGAVIGVYLSDVYNMPMIAYLIQYLIIILLSYMTKFDKLNIFIAVKSIFGIVISIIAPSEFINSDRILYMIIAWFIIYLMFKILMLVYNKLDVVVKIHYSLKNIAKEKKLYESLFKITHEIKNPLAVCKGYLEMFDAKDIKKSNKYINIINQEIDRTLLLLKDFSDVSKVNVERESMDITLLIEDVCDEISLAFDTNINFLCDFPDDEVYIWGDYNRLKQVLINLIKNAKESIMDKGFVSLTAKIVKSDYVINIKDNGVGMDDDTKKKIGTAFYTTKKNGTGLGVCLSKEIIERHDGTIKYISKLNKGTNVKLVLPIIKAS